MDHVSAGCLLRHCANGSDEQAWREFLYRYGASVEAGVRRGLRRAGQVEGVEDVEDLTQEVYCRLLEKRGRRLLAARANNDREVSGFLARIAENLVRDRARAARTLKRGVDAVVEAGASVDGVLDWRGNGEDRVLWGESANELLALSAGPRGRARVRWIARKALFDGWSSLEISQALAGTMSTAGVDAVLSRIYRRLRHHGLAPARRVASRRRG